jgi:hypothetical protein
MTSTDVRTVIIDGKIVYEDRVFPFDEEKVFEESRKAARKLWERVNTLKG